MEIKQILVPTDFSDNASHALSYAIGLAKKCSAKLHLLHTPVIPSVLLMDLSYSPGAEAVTRVLNDAQMALGEQARVIEQAKIEHIAATREGVVHQAIREYADENGIDLIVMGTRGRSGFAKLMYGSVTERVVKTANTPTIVVPPTGARVPDSVVVAYDFSAPAKCAAAAGNAIHALFHGPLHLIHCYVDVWAEYTDRGTLGAEASEKRRQALIQGLEDMLKADAGDLFSTEAPEVRTHLVAGDPATRVLALAKDVNATLICAGTSGKSGIERILMGSVSRRLLQESDVPVLFTHDDGSK